MEYEGLNRIVELMKELSGEISKINISPQIQENVLYFSDVAKTFSNKVSFDFLSEEIEDYLKKVKEDENLSREEFEAKYEHEKNLCEELGQNGWVITEHGNPGEVADWYNLLKIGKVEDIYQYFSGDNTFVFTSIVDGLRKIYIEDPEKTYFSKGLEYYNQNDYMTSAMYLVGLIEQRCKKLIDFGEYKKNAAIYSSDKGFAKHLKESYGKANGYLTRSFLFLEMYPSMISFLNRLYNDGEFTFENGVEPPYINRNWLLHGRNTRTIKQYECVQLFNALSVLEFVCSLCL